MVKICYRCDAKNDMYATVCQNCGYDLYEDVKLINAGKRKTKPLLYILFGLVLPLILVTTYFIGLYIYLYGIENYSSEVYLNKYIELVKSDNYEDIMKYNGIEEDKFNTKKEFAMYINKEYGVNHDKAIIVKNSALSSENDDFYRVQFNGKLIKEFKVSKTEEKKFNYFNTWLVNSPEQNLYSESIKIYAPLGIDVFLNEVLLTDEYISNEEEKYSYYSGIKDLDYNHPKLYCYEVKDLMAISSVQAKRKDGELCNITFNEGVYKVTANIPPEDLKELKPLAEEFAKKYAAFIAEDCKFSELSDYIYKNTQIYDTLKEFYNGWFPTHSAFGYENIEFNNMLWYDENHSSVQVKFNYYIIYGNNKRRDYPVAYEIYFAKIDGKWLVTNVKNF